MNMNFRHLLFIVLLLATVSFADNRCNTSYVDTLNMRALDANAMPIVGALVSVYHQYSGSLGTASSSGTYYTVGPFATGKNGTYTTKIMNIETVPSKLDCEIIVNATIAGANNYTKTIALGHPEPIDVGLNVYPVTMYLRDQTNAPIKGGVVSAAGQTKTTDENGMLIIYSQPGELEYLASYLDGKIAGKIDVSKEMAYGVAFSSYNITIDVIDDFGNPLNATLWILNNTIQLSSDGHYANPKILGNEVEFSATYDGVDKQIKMYPDLDSSMVVVFDQSAPLINNISESQEDRIVRLIINVEDIGIYPSGIETSSMTVTYKIEPSQDSSWNKATVYMMQKGVFAADFPAIDANSIVQFKIEVSDKEGNKAIRTGRFTLAPPEVPPSTGGNTQQEPDSNGESPNFIIFGGAILVVIAIFMFARMKKGGGGG